MSLLQALQRSIIATKLPLFLVVLALDCLAVSIGGEAQDLATQQSICMGILQLEGVGLSCCLCLCG